MKRQGCHRKHLSLSLRKKNFTLFSFFFLRPVIKREIKAVDAEDISSFSPPSAQEGRKEEKDFLPFLTQPISSTATISHKKNLDNTLTTRSQRGALSLNRRWDVHKEREGKDPFLLSRGHGRRRRRTRRRKRGWKFDHFLSFAHIFCGGDFWGGVWEGGKGGSLPDFKNGG